MQIYRITTVILWYGDGYLMVLSTLVVLFRSKGKRRFDNEFILDATPKFSVLAIVFSIIWLSLLSGSKPFSCFCFVGLMGL